MNCRDDTWLCPSNHCKSVGMVTSSNSRFLKSNVQKLESCTAQPTWNWLRLGFSGLPTHGSSFSTVIWARDNHIAISSSGFFKDSSTMSILCHLKKKYRGNSESSSALKKSAFYLPRRHDPPWLRGSPISFDFVAWVMQVINQEEAKRIYVVGQIQTHELKFPLFTLLPCQFG